MQPVRSYVIRIYRQDRRVTAGVLEDVRTGKSRFFRSFSELWRLLSSRRSPSPHAADPDPEPSSTHGALP